MKAIHRLALSTLTGLSMSAHVTAMPLVSTFDAGPEGWTVGSSQGEAGVGSFDWFADGGQPGGHVRATDLGDQGGWWFVSPTGWAGDWSAYLGGIIAFDVFATAGQSDRLNPPVEAVVLGLADGGRLRSISSSGAALDRWVSVEVVLAEDRFLLTGSGYGSFAQALAHVEWPVIPGDFVYRQQDVTRLDNVRVMGMPEPASWLLVLGGITMLGSQRLRRRS